MGNSFTSFLYFTVFILRARRVCFAFFSGAGSKLMNEFIYLYLPDSSVRSGRGLSYRVSPNEITKLQKTLNEIRIVPYL